MTVLDNTDFLPGRDRDRALPNATEVDLAARAGITQKVPIFEVTDDMLPMRKPATNGGHGFGRPKFSRDDIRDMLAAYQARETLRSIARRHDCTPEAVRYQLRRHGIERRPAVDKPVTLDHPCSRCGIDTDCLDMCRDCVDVLALDGDA